METSPTSLLKPDNSKTLPDLQEQDLLEVLGVGDIGDGALDVPDDLSTNILSSPPPAIGTPLKHPPSTGSVDASKAHQNNSTQPIEDSKVCKICKPHKTFSSSKFLIHLAMFHFKTQLQSKFHPHCDFNSISETNIVRCTYCQKMFSNWLAFYLHLEKHNVLQKMYEEAIGGSDGVQCKQCSLFFPTLEAVEKHASIKHTTTALNPSLDESNAPVRPNLPSHQSYQPKDVVPNTARPVNPAGNNALPPQRPNNGATLGVIQRKTDLIAELIKRKGNAPTSDPEVAQLEGYDPKTQKLEAPANGKCLLCKTIINGGPKDFVYHLYLKHFKQMYMKHSNSGGRCRVSGCFKEIRNFYDLHNHYNGIGSGDHGIGLLLYAHELEKLRGGGQQVNGDLGPNILGQQQKISVLATGGVEEEVFVCPICRRDPAMNDRFGHQPIFVFIYRQQPV